MYRNLTSERTQPKVKIVKRKSGIYQTEIERIHRLMSVCLSFEANFKANEQA